MTKTVLFCLFSLSISAHAQQSKVDLPSIVDAASAQNFDLGALNAAGPNHPVLEPDSKPYVSGVDVRKKPTVESRVAQTQSLDSDFDGSEFKEPKVDLYVWEKIDGTPFEVGAGISREKVGPRPYRKRVTRAEATVKVHFDRSR